MLLGSPPDTVHGTTLRGTNLSSLLIWGRRHILPPGAGIHPCCSGLQVQGTANSPTSAALFHAETSEKPWIIVSHLLQIINQIFWDIRIRQKFAFFILYNPNLFCYNTLAICVRSSMDRASDSGSESWGFESLRACQNSCHPFGWRLFCFIFCRRGSNPERVSGDKKTVRWTVFRREV